ncbi:hypothetical protein [Clostridium celatum]|uniref:Uncharacterized protein n=1 Tax=Clostridium celatum DSM 1785 TaxID=545697 RepID=L1QKZ1_9CLOT|nr:hypothetical protein [Clostridium celatum]EKY28611.1 hypothetical protein HMPREF0216_00664 [Clostridium celatum DSM 1785]MCE9654923.1 hypothetical protein [Clostridium celatum]MDU3722466.1 hypothetical protein [Clostridium celatum]MDY3360332.1 hypothetical protein [Clostridium celatum]
MDRRLILKLIGKKDSVDLDDSIYNLREIGEEIRGFVILTSSVDDNFEIRNKRRLESVLNIIKPISNKLKDDDNIKGYTNSKKYLIKYLDDLCINIEGILSNIDRCDIKKLTYYTNVLMDLVLIY